MNLLNRIMSYDKTKLNQENCNCEECVSSENVKSENHGKSNCRISKIIGRRN